MAVGSVTVDLKANTGSFETDFKRAARVADQQSKQIATSAIAAGTAIGHLMADAVEGIAHMIERSLQSSAQLADLASKTGLSAAALGGLRLAATQSGIEMDQLGKAVTKVAGIQFDAAAGSKKAAAEMKFFGIVAKDTADDAVDKMLKGFNALPASFDRAGLAVKIFGDKIGTDFLLVADKARDGLQGLEKDADRLGVGLSGETLKAAEDFEATMGLLKLQFAAVGEKLLVQVLPSITALATLMGDPQIVNGLTAIGAAAISALSAVVQFVTGTVLGIQTVMQNLAAINHGAAAGDLVREGDEIDRLEKRIAKIQAKSGTFAGTMQSLFNPDQEAVGELRGNAMQAIIHPIIPQEELDFLKKRLATVTTQFNADNKAAAAAAGAPAAAEAAANDAAAKSAEQWKAAEKALMDALAKSGAGHKEHAKHVKDDTKELEAIARAADNFNLKLEGLQESMKGPVGQAMAQQARALNQFRELADKGKISAEQFAKAQALVAEQTRRAVEAAKAQAAGPLEAEDNHFEEQKRQLIDAGLAADKYNIALARLARTHDLETKAIKRQLDPIGALIDDLKFESSLLGMTNEQRAEAIELRNREATAATADGKAIIDALRQQQAAERAYKSNAGNGLSAGWEKWKAEAEDVSGQVENATTNAFQSMEDALLEFVTTGKFNFADFAKAILIDIEKIIIKMLILKAIEAVIGDGSSFGSSGSYANGAAFSGGNVIPFARGGVVNSPTLFPMANGAGLMGEAGPEAIMPLKRGNDGKLGVTVSGPQRSSSGDGVVVNIITNVDNTGKSDSKSSGGDSQTSRQLADAMRLVVLRELTTQQKPGGQLWKMAHNV